MTAAALTRPAKLLLVCSSGGHLFELLSVSDLWNSGAQPRERAWVCFETADAVSLLEGERVHWAHFPTNRNVLNLWRNWRLSKPILEEERPDVVISTGAGVAVPFLLRARKMGIPTIYIESIARTEDLSTSGKLLHGRVDRFLVQWPELLAKHPDTEFLGRIL